MSMRHDNDSNLAVEQTEYSVDSQRSDEAYYLTAQSFTQSYYRHMAANDMKRPAQKWLE